VLPHILQPIPDFAPGDEIKLQPFSLVVGALTEGMFGAALLIYTWDGNIRCNCGVSRLIDKDMEMVVLYLQLQVMYTLNIIRSVIYMRAPFLSTLPQTSISSVRDFAINPP